MPDRSIGYFKLPIKHYYDKYLKSKECPNCHRTSDLAENLKVCPHCNCYLPFTAMDWIYYLTGKISVKQIIHHKEIKDELHSKHPRFKKKLHESKKKSGFKDGLITMRTNIDYHPVVLTILNFDFFNGTIGPVEGEKFARAIQIAKNNKLPLISIWTSYGMNMYLDIESLYQMPKITYYLSELNMPYISILSGTVLGGTSVSFVQGDIIIAEKESIFGFTGKNIIKKSIPIPDKFQTEEEALKSGKVDMIAERKDIKTILLNILNCLDSKNYSECQKIKFQPPDIAIGAKISNHSAIKTEINNNYMNAFNILGIAKHYKRPTCIDYLKIFDQFVELKGDRISGDGPTIIAGLALIDKKPLIVIGIEKGKFIEKGDALFSGQKIFYNNGMPGPTEYRKARRIIRFAEKAKLPVVFILDTSGARMDPVSERGNIAYELNETMKTILNLKTWTVAINIGEGGSGGYIALACADKILMQKYAYAAIAACEAKASILYPDEKNSLEIAANNSEITSKQLLDKHYIDRIINEPEGGAHLDTEKAIEYIEEAIKQELEKIYNLPNKIPTTQDIQKRIKRFTAV